MRNVFEAVLIYPSRTSLYNVFPSAFIASWVSLGNNCKQPGGLATSIAFSLKKMIIFALFL